MPLKIPTSLDDLKDQECPTWGGPALECDRCKSGACATDALMKNRGEYPRRGGPCSHRGCQNDPRGCRAYADEAVIVTDDDTAFAERLVADGWWSTSRRYCRVARWREPPPSLERVHAALLEVGGPVHGPRLVKIFDRYNLQGGISAPEERLEHLTITPAQMRAFKLAGGDCARF